MNPFDIVRDFEAALAEYTGAPYVVTVNSCTAALRLSLLWCAERMGKHWNVCVPHKTYPSVPMQVRHAGFKINWMREPWEGEYWLGPTNVHDCALWFTGGMYRGGMRCVSFHPQKPLGLSNGGGAILHDDPHADRWFRKMRFDGRTEGVPTKDDNYTMLGEHCYMMPPTAAEGLHRLSIYARQYEHPPFPVPDYPDCSLFEVFT